MLTALFGWLAARSQDAQFMLEVSRDQQSGKPITSDRAEALWGALERSHFRIRWLFSPAVALLVGAFTGLLSSKHALQLALVTVAPFAAVFSVGTRPTLQEVGFLGLYVIIAAFAAWTVARLVHARRHRTPFGC
jgi:hypothetical protein